MARLATLGEAAAMRIGMAITAGVKRDSLVARLPVGSWSVAPTARNICVQSAEGIPRQRMIELRDVLKYHEVVTMQAVRAKSSLM